MDILKVKVNNEWVAIPSITGQRGIGIQSITKTNTQGLVDTYTILFSDGNSTTFNISNGAVPSFTIGNNKYLIIDSATEQNNKNGTLV